MLVAAFAMVCALTPSTGASPATHPPAQAARAGAPSGKGRLRAFSAADLYSARAKRRIASFLRMRLLELRLRSLDRAADVVEHRLSLDELLRSP
jgi:hypothetical protein